MTPPRSAKRPLLAALVFAIAVAAVWQAILWSDRAVVADLRAVASERLNLYQSTLNAALAKYRYLPFLIARDETIKRLLVDQNQRGGRSPKASRALSEINAQAGTDVLFVMDRTGTTLAASNWQDPLSFVGRNYAFRPYFKDAMQGRQGGFFAIGATTGQPGYFMSYPVRSGASIVGVAVVKIDLDPLQSDWRNGGETVFVADANGVIFLSSQDRWTFRTLAPLSTQKQNQIRQQQQYRGQDLTPLDIAYSQIAGAQSITIDDRRYLQATRALTGLGWKLSYLSRVTPIEKSRQVTFLAAMAAIIVLATLALYWRERRQKIISRRRAREGEKFSAINRQLQLEIEERRTAESQLRNTQAQLLQAGKLAALGKMSAAIAHEINQPIAAIRTYSASARLMLEKGLSANLDTTLSEISGLTERMAVITGQLKTFARKAPVRLHQLDVREAVHHVENMMSAAAAEEHCALDVHLPEGAVMIEADSVRLEQILTNLLRNALDAVREVAQKRVTVTLSHTDQQAKITVTDSGPGVDADVQEHLFDPFFTTKDIGQGVGLGLSITYGIVADLNGDIRVTNVPGGGAQFVVTLPLCKAQNHD